MQGKNLATWINVLPIANVGNLLSGDELRIAVTLRVGADICAPCKCHYRKSIDCLGLHGLSCHLNTGRFPRHSEITRIMNWAFASINILSVLEPVGLSHTEGKRPDGMTLCPWSR